MRLVLRCFFISCWASCVCFVHVLRQCFEHVSYMLWCSVFNMFHTCSDAVFWTCFLHVLMQCFEHVSYMFWSMFPTCSDHGQLKLRPYFLPWVSKNRRYVLTIQSLFWILFTWILLFFNLKFDFSLLKIEIWKKNHLTR